jgi:hypothetical protein
VFNNIRCSVCHATPVGGSGSVTVVRFGFIDQDGNFDPLEDLGGSLLRSKPSIRNASKSSPRTKPTSSNSASPTPPWARLVAAISDDDLLSGAGASPGRANMVPVLEDPDAPLKVGRFGWKAQLATVMSFSADASLMEQGITSEILPDPVAPNNDHTLMEFCDSFGPDHPQEPIDEDGVRFTERITDFQRFLAPPPQTPRSGMTGEALFNQIGCNVCHVSAWTTADDPELEDALRNRTFQAYSDYLLHDMGEVGDFIAQNGAMMGEVRTPALWGLRVRDPIWHDGRIAGGSFEDRILEAIDLHRAEGTPAAADAAANAFFDLTGGEQGQVLAFLDSLGRAEFDADGDNSVLFSDFLHFRDCFTGPGGNVSPDDLCAVHDINQDGSIDETDFQYFLEAYDDVLVDCNGSGNPDIVDIILGNSTDNNGNGIPDECDANPYDLDDNGIVNGADLAIMLGNWGPCTQPAHLCIGDFNADGQVDGADLAILLGNWG